MENNFIRSILQLVSNDELSEENAYLLIKEYRAQVQGRETSGRECQQSIAIVGMACRFPQADTKEELWDNLMNSVDGIRPLPASRQELMGIKADSAGENNYAVAGYLDKIDQFDADFFHILSGEAKYMDPQQRMFMQVGYEAMEDAGYDEKLIRNTKTGIYVGYSEARYKELVDSNASVAFVGNFPPVIASRLSYSFGLRGPAVSVATACSSSLVALHLACNALKMGECEAALVGGVTVASLPPKVEEGGLGITSQEGRSRSFDDDADGTGWGEGCGAIYIKTLDKAVRDKDHIYAVIKGSAINQDGASNGIASPNAKAQTEVIVQAWENAGIDPLNIGYIEAHGTGTKIGDPIEIKGITNAFKHYTDKKQFCGIGSVKSNFGHLDSCSGIAGLIKVIMALKNKKIPPTLHFQTPNSLMNLIDSAVYVNTELSKWEKPEKALRCAGISSFGLSGTNCHVVLEEYEEKAKDSALHHGYLIFTLSAKSEKSLWSLVEKYCCLLADGCEYRLDEICYNLNVCRAHYPYRIAIPVESMNELKRKLELLKYKRGAGIKDEHIYMNLSGEDIVPTARVQKIGNLSRLDSLVAAEAVSEFYTTGGDISWKVFYPEGGCRKISLPTYAWDEKSYWIHPADNTISRDFGLKPKSVSNIEVVCQNGALPTETEVKLAQIWGKVLGLSVVDIEEDFFMLGGDSLLATDFVNNVNKELGCKIHLADFFTSPNIRNISRKMSGSDSSNTIRKTGIKPYYSVSSSQRRQYILKQFAPDNLGYNMPGAIIVSGNMDIERFKEIFQKLVDRHEAFRTCFDIVGSHIVQRVIDKIDFAVSIDETDEPDINDIVRNFVKPFELDTPPLLRVGLYKLKSDLIGNKYLFLFDMHHIISDGVSMEILLTEFMSLYQGVKLPDLYLQYRDYAEWQAGYLDNGGLKSQKEYWMRELEEHYKSRTGEFELLCDFPRPMVMTYEGAEVDFLIESDIADTLRTLSAQNGGTLYMILLAVYSVMLHAYTGEKNMIVGSLVAGRGQPGLDKIIGLFTNYLPICIAVRENLSFMEFFDYIIGKTVDAFENQDYPFDRIVEDLKKERDLSKNPIFSTMLVLHNQGLQNTTFYLEDMELNAFSWEKRSSILDLKLDIFQKVDGSLNCRFEYCVSLFRHETVVMLASAFKRIISIITGSPHIKVKELPVFSEEERRANAYRFMYKNLERQKQCLLAYRKQQDVVAGEKMRTGDREYEIMKIELSEKEFHDFCQLAQENMVSWNTLLLACYIMLLIQLTQRNDIFVGILFSQQKWSYPVPLLVQREATASFEELLKSVDSKFRETEKGLLDSFDVSFEVADISRELFFMYDFLFRFNETDNGDESWADFGPDYQTGNLLLGLSAAKNGGGLLISFLQKKNLPEAQSLHQFSYRFSKVLSTLINNKDTER